jgi:hypothetical protein
VELRLLNPESPKSKVVVTEANTTSEQTSHRAPIVDLNIWDPVDNGGMFEVILENAEEFYHEIELLPNAGFAVGNSLLPEDMSLLTPSDGRYFTGNAPSPHPETDDLKIRKCYGSNTKHRGQ